MAGNYTYTFSPSMVEEYGCPDCSLYFDLGNLGLVSGNWTSITITGSYNQSSYYWVKDGDRIWLSPFYQGMIADYIYYRVTGPGGSDNGQIYYSLPCNVRTVSTWPCNNL